MEQDDLNVLETRNSLNLKFWSLLEDYGWYLLLLTFAFTYLFKTVITPRLSTYLRKREDEKYAAKYHKDPDAVAQKIADQHSVVRKLQEKYDLEAKKYKEKMEEKEARKRAEWLERHMLPGQKLGNGDSKSTSLRPEYNPLMGNSSTGSSYKPKKKSGCSGGGCGK